MSGSWPVGGSPVRDDRIANRIPGAPVPKLERIRAAAEDGRSILVA
jgi:hypothetical protein